MPQEWTKPPEDTELQDVEQPVGSNDDLDDGGYDPADDPASREPEGSLPPSRDPGRGPTTYPVAPAAIPAWVQPLGNGKVPVDRMIKVAPLGAGYLVPEAAAAWRNLQNAASAAGFTLTMTGAYRSYDQQVQLFNERYSTSNTGGSSKVWNGTQYWLKPNVAMAAVPGTSNHGWGCAVDTALGGTGRTRRRSTRRSCTGRSRTRPPTGGRGRCRASRGTCGSPPRPRHLRVRRS